ncbi:MAG: hypothetical protein Fur0034_06830 [Desulfuromonadia bacterium]
MKPLAGLLLLLLAGCGVKGRLLPPDPPPGAVGNITFRQIDRGILLSWTPQPPPGTKRTTTDTGYRVLRTVRQPSETRCVRCDDAWSPVVTLHPGSPPTFLDSPLETGLVYRYRIIPVDSRGVEGTFVDTPSIPLVTPPTPPSVTASLSGGGVLLTLPPPPPAGGFRIVRRDDTGKEIILTPKPARESTFTDRTVIPSRRYGYRAVTILTHDGLTVESAPSLELFITFSFP